MQVIHTETPRDQIIAANEAGFNEPTHTIPWITPSRAMEAEAQRAMIMASMEPFITQAYKQTKPHFKELAPGCRICGRGEWSCLFINGKCNCRCFYCPTAQDDISVPTTNQVPFSNAFDYADYVSRFDFSGVSISGGEPLLTFDRTVEYMGTVRDELGKGLHIWMYTNGTLLTKERLKILKEVGLNEIRFDISAVDYDLKKPQMAADFIPYVTVEIPAIPEDFDRLTRLLPVMSEIGVQHLNLHQLRLTPHNSANLRKRNYTFLHGESITIMESEMVALGLLQKAAEQDLPLPINYCSYVYKHRYQQAATRRRNARGIMKGYESVTENGFIRSLSLTGDPEILGKQADALDRTDTDSQRWAINTKKDRLHFHETLWPIIDRTDCRLQLTYSEAVLCPFISYHCAFKEVRLDSGKKIYIEKRPIRLDLPLSDDELPLFEKLVIKQAPEAPPTMTPSLEEIIRYEFIQPGLQDYF
ncbi:MAG: radical SAM protein [Deltaproteobacteria bacterium]|nr:radical SAM protein [Deltaproteobacteria bacterium]